MKDNLDGLINSDVTMIASKTFDNILDTIKNSNLNFHLQLSPFSAVISLKKSPICDKSGSPLLPNSNFQEFDNKSVILRNQQLEAEVVKLENHYNSLAQQYNSACAMIKSLEEQIIENDKRAAQSVNECHVIIKELKYNISK